MDVQALMEDFSRRGIRLIPNPPKLVVEPASILTDADRVAIRTHKGELLALLSPDPVADRIVTELGGSLIREVPAGQLPPIWDDLTEVEKGAELRAWCRRNRVSYPEGLERLREAEIDRLAMA